MIQEIFFPIYGFIRILDFISHLLRSNGHQYFTVTFSSPPFSSSVSVGPFAPHLIGSVGHVFVVSSIPSDSCILSSPLPLSFLVYEGRDLIETSYFDSLTPCIRSDYGSLHPLPSAVRESLSDDHWTRYQSMTTAEYH